MSSCPECGTTLDANVLFCPQCGHRAEAPASFDSSDSSKSQSSEPESITPEQSPAVSKTEGNEPSSQQVPASQATNPINNFQPSRRDEPEVELWEGTFSSKAMVGEWILAGFVSIAAIAVAIFASFSSTAWLVTLGIIALIWVGLWVRLFLRRLSVHYRLTSQRFFHQAGILRRTTDRIEVIDMDDITFEQGLLDRFFGIGTIRITSSDATHPLLLVKGIDDVQRVSNMMDEGRRKERVRRGLHIESV